MTKQYYQINKDGKIIGTWNTKPPAEFAAQKLPPPPDSMLDPRHLNGAWVDTATLTDRQQAIDKETNAQIKKWCAAQGKNEEYYLNCGIENGKDCSEYRSYREQAEKIKKIQKAKKEALK